MSTPSHDVDISSLTPDQLAAGRTWLAKCSDEDALIEARVQMAKLPAVRRLTVVADPGAGEDITANLKPLRFGTSDKALFADPRLLPDRADDDSKEQRLERIAVMAQIFALEAQQKENGDWRDGEWLATLNVEISALSKITGINYTVRVAPDVVSGGVELSAGRAWQWQEEIKAELYRAYGLYDSRRAGRLARQGAKKQSLRCEEAAAANLDRVADHEGWADRFREAVRQEDRRYEALRRPVRDRRSSHHGRSARGAKTVSRASARRAASRSGGGTRSGEPPPSDPEPSDPGRLRPLRRLQPHSSELASHHRGRHHDHLLRVVG